MSCWSHSSSHPIQGDLRLVEHSPGLADDRGLLGIDPIIGAVGREPEPGARLLKRGHRLVEPMLIVASIDPAHDLALVHATAEVNADLLESAWDLRPQDNLFVGGQGSRGLHRARHLLQDGGKDPHRTRGGRGRFGGLSGGGDGIVSLATPGGEGHPRQGAEDDQAIAHGPMG